MGWWVYFWGDRGREEKRFWRCCMKKGDLQDCRGTADDAAVSKVTWDLDEKGLWDENRLFGGVFEADVNKCSRERYIWV